MKALSIMPEFAHLIFTGDKTVECRTWNTNYRGEFLVCATKDLVPGFISGHGWFTVNLVDVVPFTKEHLAASCMEAMPAEKCYAWILEEPTLVYPIPVRGMPGLFTVDDSLIRYPDDEVPENATDDEVQRMFEEFEEKYLIPITYIPDQL